MTARILGFWQEKLRSRVTLLQSIPPCGGCPSRIDVFLIRLDAPDDKLASVIYEVIHVSADSTIQFRRSQYFSGYVTNSPFRLSQCDF